VASSGPEWKRLFEKHNGGTYNNQYMIIDFNLFKPHNALPDNLLWVVEQIPGLVVGEDLTATLRLGYWPSYNVPYFPVIYKESGYDTVDKKENLTIGSQYELAPRAMIYRRDAGKVNNLKDIENFLRSNDYSHDPYSKGDPTHAVCARGDLMKDHPSMMGCYDTKVSNMSLFWNMTSYVVNGPTTDGVKPFSWGSSHSTDAHMGQPDKFDFQFEKMSFGQQ